MDFLKYLFRSASEYSNFDIFGGMHLAIILIGFTGIVFILKRMESNRKFEKFVGSVLLAQQTILYAWYLTTGYNLLTEGLPLYHCRVAIILSGIGLLFNKAIFRKIGATWGLIGAISALVYPSGLDPFVFPHISQFSFFIGHLFLLWSSVYCIFVEGIKLNERELKATVYFTNIYHALMFILDHAIEANYGYMRLSPIGIGNELHPVVYGLIVMTLFNGLIAIMNVLMTRQQIEEDELVEVFA